MTDAEPDAIRSQARELLALEWRVLNVLIDGHDRATAARLIAERIAADGWTRGPSALREAAQKLLDACISDFGDYPDEPEDEPVAAGEGEWKSAITFGLLNGLKAALANRGDAKTGALDGR